MDYTGHRQPPVDPLGQQVHHVASSGRPMSMAGRPPPNNWAIEMERRRVMELQQMRERERMMAAASGSSSHQQMYSSRPNISLLPTAVMRQLHNSNPNHSVSEPSPFFFLPSTLSFPPSLPPPFFLLPPYLLSLSFPLPSLLILPSPHSLLIFSLFIPSFHTNSQLTDIARSSHSSSGDIGRMEQGTFHALYVFFFSTFLCFVSPSLSTVYMYSIHVSIILLFFSSHYYFFSVSSPSPSLSILLLPTDFPSRPVYTHSSGLGYPEGLGLMTHTRDYPYPSAHMRLPPQPVPGGDLGVYGPPPQYIPMPHGEGGRGRG